jgi:hypothetical protein
MRAGWKPSQPRGERLRICVGAAPCGVIPDEYSRKPQCKAEREKAAARLNEYIADMNLAQQSLVAGNLGRAVQLVDKHLPAPGAPDLRGFEWRLLWQLCRGSEHTALPRQEGSVLSVAMSPDGRQVALGIREQLKVMDRVTRANLATIARGAHLLAYLPDGVP